MQVVIVGGGFGGVRTARLLARDPKMKITLISDEPYFLYHGALTDVAAGRDLAGSTVSLGRVFAEFPNVNVVHDRITTIDPHRKLVSGKKDYSYDELVLALGSVANYFGTKGAAGHTYGIKTLEEIDRFEQHIEDEITADKLLDKNYVIVGAGATGVELAGTLSRHLNDVVARHEVKKTRVSVTLAEVGPIILPRFSKTARKKALARLDRLGITVLVNQKVEAVSDDDVLIDGRHVPTHTVLWTSGTAQHPLFTEHDALFKHTTSGRVVVDKHMQAAPYISVIGDNASTKYAGLATTAITDAAFIAKVLRAKARKRQLPIYRPVRFPSVVLVDRDWAYVESHGIYLAGRLGLFARHTLEHQILTQTLGHDGASVILRTSKAKNG